MDNQALTAFAAAAKDVRLPTFCATDAASWFARVEVEFRLKKETSDTRKADLVLSALPAETFPLITDWLAKRTEQDGEITYPALKKHLLQKFVATPEERADKILALARQPIGDQRPSVALQEMKALTRIPCADGTTKKLDLLHVLWLHRLPDDVRRGIVDFSSTTEDELAKRADSLQAASRSTTSHTTIAAAAEPPQPKDDPPAEEEGAAAATSSYQPRWRPQYHHKRAISRQPPRGTPPRKAAQGLCTYHSRFGHEARNCKEPCSWPKNL